jgi:NAD(P)-dependent dehydrogenase (short-subunit alcohol dehydrogenase family)
MSLNPPITDWSQQVVWIVGASSGIGRATAERLHALGARVAVSARNATALADFTRGRAGTWALPADAGERGALAGAAEELLRDAGRIDLAVYCAGHYTPQNATAYDLDQMLQHQQVNVVGALHFLDAVLPPLLAQAAAGRPAHLSLVASVAGYRGLPKALAYGPTKAAMINLAEVLHLDLAPRGIGVSIVNPGFVRTPLTAANTFQMPALIEPEEAARCLVAGWQAGAFEIHFPKRFTRWMKLMRLLPYRPYFAAVRRGTGS